MNIKINVMISKRVLTLTPQKYINHIQHIKKMLLSNAARRGFLGCFGKIPVGLSFCINYWRLFKPLRRDLTGLDSPSHHLSIFWIHRNM